jgi:CIC family chloride channel protein
MFVIILSILIGVISALIAVTIKWGAHIIREYIQAGIKPSQWAFSYIILPSIGILLTVLFIKYVLKHKLRPGIPNVLYGISKNDGKIKSHNMYSSILSSSITVGFGGSVGLEGPTITSCTAWASNIGTFFRLNYKQTTLLLACAAAATIAAIFKAPIAAIVFALEVIMLDLTMWALIPLLLASMSSVLTSYFFMGQDVLYPFEITNHFELKDIGWYIGLGVFCGLISYYFTHIYLYIEKLFKRIKRSRTRLLIGGLSLGILLFVFPSLYGEGYEDINTCLRGDYSYLFDNSIFFNFSDNQGVLIILLLAIILTKVLATSLTISAGGVGGIFAPSLFIGVNAGALYSLFFNSLGISNLHINNFALIGMGGMIAGVLHAPLTGIFLIADISGGYHLFVPLMLTATISYATVKYFVSQSVYTAQLASRRELMTHDKDKRILSIMKMETLIEQDFLILDIDDSFLDILEAISNSSRNVFPVVGDKGVFMGYVSLDAVRKHMFKPEMYDALSVKDFLEQPRETVNMKESMHDIASTFAKCDSFNIVVLQEGKYVGFVSRAKVFSKYRKLLKYFSDD